MRVLKPPAYNSLARNMTRELYKGGCEMQYTSAQANKILKKLAEERERLLSLERAGKVFIAATTEDKESARPEYSYKDRY